MAAKRAGQSINAWVNMTLQKISDERREKTGPDYGKRQDTGKPCYN